MLERFKAAKGIVEDDFNDEIQSLLDAGETDLVMDGLNPPSPDDAYWQRAVITYALAHFRSPANYEQLVSAYETMKGQMHSSSMYTDWGER